MSPLALWCWLSIWRSSNSRIKACLKPCRQMLSAQVASRKYYDYIEEAIVRSADRLSTHSYELGTAFKNKPVDQLFTSAHGGRKYKRLAPAQEIA